MTGQRFLHPEGLSDSLFSQLIAAADLAASKEFGQLLADCDAHVNNAKIAFDTIRMVNLKLAEAIFASIHQAAQRREQLHANQHRDSYSRNAKNSSPHFVAAKE